MLYWDLKNEGISHNVKEFYLKFTTLHGVFLLNEWTKQSIDRCF